MEERLSETVYSASIVALQSDPRGQYATISPVLFNSLNLQIKCLEKKSSKNMDVSSRLDTINAKVLQAEQVEPYRAL